VANAEVQSPRSVSVSAAPSLIADANTATSPGDDLAARVDLDRAAVRDQGE
jgi:hypothetical protein